MSYANLTFQDKNPVKRWLQRQRLLGALKLAPPLSGKNVLDFGAGNGELFKNFGRSIPNCKLTCYEPDMRFLAEAKENLNNVVDCVFCQNIKDLPSKSMDVIFCLEVLEHLSPSATKDVFEQIDRLLSVRGIAIIGVPIEIGLPALIKGSFRMARSFGDFDATPKNVLLATIGMPPTNRPVKKNNPNYASSHLGFDHRLLRVQLGNYFQIIREVCDPFPIIGPYANSEIYFVISKLDFE